MAPDFFWHRLPFSDRTAKIFLAVACILIFGALVLFFLSDEPEPSAARGHGIRQLESIENRLVIGQSKAEAIEAFRGMDFVSWTAPSGSAWEVRAEGADDRILLLEWNQGKLVHFGVRAESADLSDRK